MVDGRKRFAILALVIARNALFATLFAFIAMFSSTGSANAELDLTGAWNWLGSDPPQPIQVVHSGVDLSIDLGFEGGPFVGTIDNVTGEFILVGFLCSNCVGIALIGTASPDGNSMSGKLVAGGSFSEPFSFVRKPAATDTPTPTSTPTSTSPPPPAPVGGIGFAPDLSALPLEAADDRSDRLGLRLPIAALAGVAFAGAAWYARRRLLR